MLKEVAEKLIASGIYDAIRLKELNHLNKNLAALKEQFLVVDILERKFVVRVEL